MPYTVATLLALGEVDVADIWAKPLGTNHRRILKSTGASHIVCPKAALGDGSPIWSLLEHFSAEWIRFAVRKCGRPKK